MSTVNTIRGPIDSSELGRTLRLLDAACQLAYATPLAEGLGLVGKAVREKGVGLIVAAGTQSMPHRFDATFQDSACLLAENNSSRGQSAACASADGDLILVSPGESIPGVPEHQLRLVGDYWITDRWSG